MSYARWCQLESARSAVIARLLFLFYTFIPNIFCFSFLLLLSSFVPPPRTERSSSPVLKPPDQVPSWRVSARETSRGHVDSIKRRGRRLILSWAAGRETPPLLGEALTHSGTVPRSFREPFTTPFVFSGCTRGEYFEVSKRGKREGEIARRASRADTSVQALRGGSYVM